MRRRTLTIDQTGLIDLGLSVYWATCNVGAESPEEYGWYFQWADPTPYNLDRTPVGGGSKKEFSFKTYKYCEGSENTLTKYNNKANYGIVDMKTVLDAEDDMVTVNMKGNWRTPTTEEYEELFNACNSTDIYDYEGTGVKGVLLTLKSDSSKTIFFPYSGYLQNESNPQLLGTQAYYWTRANNSNEPDLINILYIYNGRFSVDTAVVPRSLGLATRGVLPK